MYVVRIHSSRLRKVLLIGLLSNSLYNLVGEDNSNYKVTVMLELIVRLYCITNRITRVRPR